VVGYQRLWRPCCLHFHHYKAPQPRRPRYESSSWYTQISLKYYL